MTRLLLLVAMLAPLARAEDAVEIVRRSLDRDREYLKLVERYTYVERQENRQLDANGNVKERESRTWDVTMVDGSPYRQLIARNDKPLAGKEAAREAEKLRRGIELRRNETEAQRQARMAEAERKLRKQHDAGREIVEAFDLRLVGEESVQGQPAWIIEGTPKRGYQPRSNLAQFFPKVKGRIWVTKNDYQWVRIDAESIETISFGAILARVAKGATIRIEQTRVNNEVWLPLHIDIAATARIALIKMFRGQVELTFRDYRKFQADSRIVPEGAGKQ